MTREEVEIIIQKGGYLWFDFMTEYEPNELHKPLRFRDQNSCDMIVCSDGSEDWFPFIQPEWREATPEEIDKYCK